MLFALALCWWFFTISYKRFDVCVVKVEDNRSGPNMLKTVWSFYLSSSNSSLKKSSYIPNIPRFILFLVLLCVPLRGLRSLDSEPHLILYNMLIYFLLCSLWVLATVLHDSTIGLLHSFELVLRSCADFGSCFLCLLFIYHFPFSNICPQL